MKKICSILLVLVLLIVPMSISVSAELSAEELELLEEIKNELALSGELTAEQQKLYGELQATVDETTKGKLNTEETRVLDALKDTVVIEGKALKIPTEYVTQAENFYKTTEINKAQADKIIELISEGKKVVTAQKDIVNDSAAAAGKINLKALKKEVREQVLDLGKKAVAVTNATLVYDGNNVTITDKTTNEVVFEDTPVVKQTGAEVDFTAIVLAVMAVVALMGAAVVIAKKNALFVK